MRWIKRLFAPYIVSLSEPYLDGQKWSYIFGGENKYEVRTFENYELAMDSHRATLAGLHLGSPYISIKLIRLDAEQTRSVRDEVTYSALIEPCL